MSSNPWVQHVKQFSQTHGIAYGCAISDPRCKNSYTKSKFPKKDSGTERDETTKMSMEDVNVGVRIRKFKKLKKKSESITTQPVVASQPIKPLNALKEKIERTKMGREDINRTGGPRYKNLTKDEQKALNRANFKKEERKLEIKNRKGMHGEDTPFYQEKNREYANRISMYHQDNPRQKATILALLNKK